MVVPTGRDRPQGDLGPEFRKLWAASAVSNLGDGVALVAGFTFAQRLPWLFALVSGPLADRLNRRCVLGGCRMITFSNPPHDAARRTSGVVAEFDLATGIYTRIGP